MSEVNALKTLRETTLAHLAQSDYEKILKAVELGGIESLTGTASMIVKSAVLKHGAHDQSSHNPKKGGGGAGSGGGGATSNQSHMGEAITDAKEDIANRISGAARTLEGNKQGENAQERIKGTIKGYKDSSALIGKPNELYKLKTKMVGAKKDVMLPSNSQPDKAYVNGYADAVIQVHSNYGNLVEEGYRFADIKSPAFPMGTYGESFGD